MDIQGRIKAIGQVQEISSSFRKREFVVTTEEQYPQDILIEFTQDKVNLLDSFQIGNYVKVDINLRGREWTSPQGEVRYFNTIQGWKITAATNEAQMQDGTYYGQGSAADAHNQWKTNQQSQPAPGNQFPPTPQYEEDDHDDLPF